MVLAQYVRLAPSYSSFTANFTAIISPMKDVNAEYTLVNAGGLLLGANYQFGGEKRDRDTPPNKQCMPY